jgi:hypothetical protein
LGYRCSGEWIIFIGFGWVYGCIDGGRFDNIFIVIGFLEIDFILFDCIFLLFPGFKESLIKFLFLIDGDNLNEVTVVSVLYFYFWLNLDKDIVDVYVLHLTLFVVKLYGLTETLLPTAELKEVFIEYLFGLFVAAQFYEYGLILGGLTKLDEGFLED